MDSLLQTVHVVDMGTEEHDGRGLGESVYLTDETEFISLARTAQTGQMGLFPLEPPALVATDQRLQTCTGHSLPALLVIA